MFKKLFSSIVICGLSIMAYAVGPPSQGLLFSQPFTNNSFTSGKIGTAVGISFIQTTTGTLTTTSNPILVNDVLSFNGQGFAVASLTGTGLTSTAFGIAMNIDYRTVAGFTTTIFVIKPSVANYTFGLEFQQGNTFAMYAYQNYPANFNYDNYNARVPNLGVGTVSGAVHIAVTWELGKPLNVYMDGRVIISFTPRFTPISDPTAFAYFGGTPESGNNAFKGTMDNITMYNRYLTPTDVRLIYNAFSTTPLSTCTSAPVMPIGIVKSIGDCTPTASQVNISPPSVTNAANLAEGFYFTNGITTFTGARFNRDPRVGGLGGFSQPNVTDFGTYTGVAYNACGSSSVTVVKETPLPEILSFGVRTITGGYYISVDDYSNSYPDNVLFFSNKKIIEKVFGFGNSRIDAEANRLSQDCNTATGICFDGLSIISPDNDDFAAVYKTIIQSCGKTIAGPSFQISLNPTIGIANIVTVPASAFDVTSVNYLLSTTNFQLFPNPAQNEITVVGNVGGIAISNYLGTIVYTGKDAVIDVSGFRKGLYFVKSGNSVLKFIKE